MEIRVEREQWSKERNDLLKRIDELKQGKVGVEGAAGVRGNEADVRRKCAEYK